MGLGCITKKINFTLAYLSICLINVLCFRLQVFFFICNFNVCSNLGSSLWVLMGTCYIEGKKVVQNARFHTRHLLRALLLAYIGWFLLAVLCSQPYGFLCCSNGQKGPQTSATFLLPWVFQELFQKHSHHDPIFLYFFLVSFEMTLLYAQNNVLFVRWKYLLR